MRVLFLDIDGVLNCRRIPKEDLIKTECGLLSKSRLDLLNKLIEETECKIVISSTWRNDRRACAEIELYKAGLVPDSIIGETPYLKTAPFIYRGNEIHGWLKMNARKVGLETYAIVDDDSDMLLWQANHCVFTDNNVGLTESITYRIKRVFASTRYID